MTPPDPHLPPDDGPLDDDTLAVDAVVEGDASAEQRRRVARDPELVARVAALRGAVAAVAEPVDPPPADVLAALRSRAIAAALDGDVVDDQPDEEGEAAPEEPVDLVVPPPVPRPVADLGVARARRRRTLPPLPAVAAVVILMVLVGGFLLVTGLEGSDDADMSTADGGAAEVSGDADGGGSGGGSDSAEPDEEASSAAADDGAGAANDAAPEATAEGPNQAELDRLRALATATYDGDEALVDELQRIDPEALVLAGSATTAGEQQSTTTVPSGSDDAAARTAQAFAADPAVVRCDEVLRSAERDIEPAIGAALVEVDGIPVLVLQNPIEVSEQAPSGIRLTVVNALDCSPRAAVVR